ncbi:hypothetical protein FNF27_04766 [Cafeteria roenbergensis]|uniref:Uncharacterized protein n=1 Tax=Cafeteria roenbergensis TaxID=33653 RepID=A0A5A8E8J8_CAFRO|nr:hypothetical protein FNF27_04766 [Cafeteria roenbergensis]
MAAPESGKGTSGRWTVLEHDMFVEGLRRFGRCWRSISQLVPTRSVVQIRTHAQKFFMKLEKTGQEIPTMDNRPGGQAPVDVADAARLVTEERSALDAGEQKPRLATLGPAVQAGGGGPSEADSAGRPRATAGRPRAGSSGGSGGSSAVVASGSVGSAAVAAPGVVAAMSRSGSSPLSQAAVDMHHGMGGNGVPTGDAAGAYFAGDGPAASAAMAPGTRPTIAMVKAPAAGGNGRSSASVASPSASIGGASPMVSSVSGRSGGQATSGQRRKSSKAGGGGSSSKRRAHRASGQSGGAGGAGRGGSAGGAASAGGGAPGGQSGRGAASRGKHSSLDMTPRLQPSPEAELIDPDSDNDDAGHGGATFDGPHHHHHHHHHHGRPHHGTASTVTLQQFSGAATSAGAAPPAVFARASSSATGDRVAMLQPVPAGAPVFSRASAGGGSGQRPRGKSEATIAFRQAPPLADFSHDEAFPFANDASSAAVQRRRAQSLATQGKHSKSVPLAPLALPGSGLGVTNVQMSPGGLLYGLARQHAAAQSVGGSPSLNFAQGDSSRGDQARGDDSDDDAASPAHPTAFRRGRFPPGLDVSTAESPALDGGHHMPLGRGRRGTVHRSRRASRARADEDEEEDESGLNHHHHHHHGHHHHQHQQRHQLHHQPHQQHRFLPPASSIPLGDSASSARAAAAAAAFAHGGEVGLGGNAAKRVRMAGARDASAAAMSAVAAVAEARPPPVVAEPSALSWATAAADQARQHPPAVV